MPKNNKRFIALDSFRGLCAISVAILHLNVLEAFSEIDLFRNASNFVDFFFILSGFVMYHSYGNSKHDFSFRKLIISRTFRLYPLYITMLFVFICFELLKHQAEKYGFIFNNSAFTGGNSLDELLPSIFLVQTWIRESNGMSFNYPSWSISIEYYIYILFGLILLLRNCIKYNLFLLLAATSIFSLLTSNSIVKWEIASGLSCFFIGAIINYFTNYYSELKFNPIAGTILEASCITATYFVLVSDSTLKQVVCILLFATTIAVYSLESGFISKILSARIFTYLGKLSYSIYMTHAAIIFILISSLGILSKFTHYNFLTTSENRSNEIIRYISTGSPSTDNILVIITLLLVVALSHYSYNLIELKGIQFGKQFNDTNYKNHRTESL